MAINLPRPPDPKRFDVNNPQDYIDDLDNWFSRVVAEIERDSREQSAPARAVFSTVNIAAPTTHLDGKPSVTTQEIANFLGGLINTMVARGFLRTRAGQE